MTAEHSTPASAGDALDFLEVARLSLVLDGPENTTLERVAAIAGAPLTAVQQRFPDGEALQAAVVCRDLEAGIATFDAIAAGQDSPEAQLAEAVRVLVRRSLGVGAASGVPLWGGDYARIHGTAVDRLRDQYEQRLRSFLRRCRTGPAAEGQEGEGPDDPSTGVAIAARAILQMTEGIAAWFRVGGTATAVELERYYVGFALAIAGDTGGGDARSR